MTTNILILCTHTRQAIGERMRALVQLPFDTLDDAQLRAALQRL